MDLSIVQARLSNRSDSEHQQATLRILLLGMIVLYMWARGSVDEDSRTLLLGLAGFLASAIGIFVAIWLWPAPNVPRRVLGMVADVGAITFALFLAGESGVGLVGVYLFVIFSNGFRYGRKSLFVCQALCLMGFMPVILLAPWWKEHPFIGWGLMESIIILPLYVSTLLTHLLARHAKTVEALKESLGREQGGLTV